MSSMIRLKLCKQLLDTIAANLQPMEVDLLDKMFVSESLSKFKNSYLGNFLVSSQSQFGKSTHVVEDWLSQFQDTFIGNGLIFDIKCEFIAGQ